jgi:hypothetical protein
MRRASAAAVVVLAACQSQVIPVDVSQAKYIPKAVARDELGQLLPTSQEVLWQPPTVWLRAEAREWVVDEAGVELRVEGRGHRLAYAEIKEVRLELVSPNYLVRVYVPSGAEGKEQLQVRWRAEEPAKRLVELLEALRAK